MGWVVLACKSDEEETRAPRAAAFPYSLLTDRRCFCSCDCVGIRSVHNGLLYVLLLQDIWYRGVFFFYKFGSLSFVLPRINWILFVVHGKFNYEYILGLVMDTKWIIEFYGIHLRFMKFALIEHIDTHVLICRIPQNLRNWLFLNNGLIIMFYSLY